MNIQGVIPAMYAPVQGNTASQSATTAANEPGRGATGTNGLSANDLQSTFLNLLVTELQNQDPTQPVDPTEMVSQMVSLNQLDQLIAINETLASMSAASTRSSASATAARQNTAITSGVSAASLRVPGSSAEAPAIMQAGVAGAIPPGELMNLYGTVASPGISNFAVSGGR